MISLASRWPFRGGCRKRRPKANAQLNLIRSPRKLHWTICSRLWLHGNVPPFNLALVYLGLGDHKRALDYLEEAYASDSQWMGWLKEDRIFLSLRDEPRYIELTSKLRFIK